MWGIGPECGVMLQARLRRHRWHQQASSGSVSLASSSAWVRRSAEYFAVPAAMLVHDTAAHAMPATRAPFLEIGEIAVFVCTRPEFPLDSGSAVNPSLQYPPVPI